ncbi:hypothetical protein D3C73_1130760 [compost metagenome]
MQGEKGAILWDGLGMPFAEVLEDAPSTGKFINDYKRVEAAAVEMEETFHHGCLQEMFQSLREQRPAETDCRDNIHSMAMVFGALESARTGRKLEIAGFLNPALPRAAAPQ